MTETFSTYGQEWRDQNESPRFPFADTATLTNAAGLFLPETLFLDATIHPFGGGHRAYLSRIVVESDTVTIVIGDSLLEERAYGTIALNAVPDHVPLYDNYGRPAGLLVSEQNRLSVFQSWPEGTHRFLASQTEFVARVCQPLPDTGLTGFLLESGEVISEDVILVGDDGILLRFESETVPVNDFSDETEEVTVIRVDVVGDPLFRRRLCDAAFETPRFLERLTFQSGNAGEEELIISPAEDGVIQIRVGPGGPDESLAPYSRVPSQSVFRVRSNADGIVFEVAGETVR